MKLATKSLQLAFFLVLFYSPVSKAWSSTLPSTIQALRGSCVVIPCSFTYPGSRDSWEGKFSVAWYQYRSRGYPEIYNSQSPETVLPDYQGRTEVLGDLEMGNCTLSISPVRNEDSMSYYVWINPDSVKHRFYDITVRVEVTETPNQLELSDPGLLTEGDRTLVTCSTLHTCPLAPPILTWNLDGPKAVTVQERLAGGAWRTESGFSYTPSHKDHGKYLQCTATFPNQQQSRNGIYLQVKYKPVILPQGNCTVSRTGETVTCYCVAEGNPLPSIEWRFPNRTVPGDFNSSDLQAASASWGQAIIGVLRGSASTLANVSCTATNQHGPSQVTLPTIQAVDMTLLLMVSGGAVGGVLFLSLMGIVGYKMATSRKKGGKQEEEEEEDPTLYVTDGALEQKKPEKKRETGKKRETTQIQEGRATQHVQQAQAQSWWKSH